MQIWMLQKILRFSTFQTPPPKWENAAMDVSEDFEDFELLDPQHKINHNILIIYKSYWQYTMKNFYHNKDREKRCFDT